MNGRPANADRDQYDVRDVLRLLRRRPQMLLVDGAFNSVVAFVVGYDIGLGGSLLDGFREFVRVEVGQPGSSYHFAALIKDSLDTQDDHAAVEKLLDLLEQYLVARGGPDDQRQR